MFYNIPFTEPKTKFNTKFVLTNTNNMSRQSDYQEEHMDGYPEDLEDEENEQDNEDED